MSTRVDKGGPKFKPILKSKGRPSSTPAPQDVRTRPSAQPGTSMPPPASIPERTNSIAPTLSMSSASGSSNIRLQSPSVPILPRTNTVTPVVEPSRSRGILITVSHASPTPSAPPIPSASSKVGENVEEATVAERSHKDRRTIAKRRKSRARNAETADTAETSDSPSETLVAPKKRRRRGETVERAEPEGTPEPIDPTQMKMSAICDDPGSGRLSSRWESSQIQYADARQRAREDRARAIAQADEDERESGRIGTKKGAPKPVLPGEGEAADREGDESVMENTGQNPDDFTYTESLKASRYAPQVRIGANDEIVLDMESLQVDRAADPEFGEEAYSHVEESDQSKFTNSSSWSKRRVVRWSKEDTALFYDALRQFGQNFDLIARVLPGRTYRMCKNKFKAEDKKHPGLIDDALKNGVAVDLGALSRITGKDFSGPTPVIEAKKARNLGEDQSPATLPSANVPNGRESPSSRVDGGISVEENVENASGESVIRQSASPPPPDTLLSSIGTARQSASPPTLCC
ncbi:hypothetical protein JB92DRAFT_3066625 [Gautieria morchelliformis]|nr:hypothetical protein JB92DRAFT_3066625 [Gautieria morchelliformis]